MRFAFYYLSWHYSIGILDLVGIIRNFLWFFYNFFSITILLKTLFQPFGRLGENYKKGFDLGAWFETFMVNFLMRFVGVFLRLFLIILGLVCIILTFSFGLFFLVAWLLAPLLVCVLISYSLVLISLG